METTNFAGRAGRWSAAHWKTAAFGWIAFAVLAVALGSLVGTKQMKSWAVANGESRRAEQILDRANFDLPARESVLLIDATIVRAVLVPATMKLLGEWTWYLPPWLEWLPSLSPEGESAASAPRPRPRGRIEHA